MDGKKGKELLAAGLISSGLVIIFMAAVFSVAAGAFVYLKDDSRLAPAGATPTPTVSVTLLPTPTRMPVQVMANPPLQPVSMQSNSASRTYRITLELTPAAAPVRVDQLSVTALHGDTDYGTVWSPESGKFEWSPGGDGDGEIEHGEAVTLLISMSDHGVPQDGKRTQLVIFYTGKAVLDVDMIAV